MSKARDLADSVAAGSVLADGVVSLSEVGGGTNNGVVFVNGGGTTTSGSALTYNGTSFGVGSSSYGDAGSISLSVGVAGTTTGGLQLWSTTTGSHAFQWGDGTSGSDTYRGAIEYAHSGDTMRFYTSATEQMRLTSTGLGIGTSSPLARLTVSDSSNPDSGTMTLGNNASFNGTLQYLIGPGELRISQVGSSSLGTTFYTNGAEQMRIDSSGELTTTNGKFNLITVGRGAGAVATNTAVGASALGANTSGGYNAAFGTSALSLTQGGSFNTGLGWGALALNVSGAQNTAVGQNALYTNTGDYNTAVGRSALLANTSGGNNVAIGREALIDNTTASNNTAVGYQAGYANTTGEIDAFGKGALSSNIDGSNNAAFGRDSLATNTTGASNTAVGRAALVSNTTGSYNVAVGHLALISNDTASYNTAVGYQAGYSNTTAESNTAVGSQSLYTNTAPANTAVGTEALKYSTTGVANTAVGGRHYSTSLGPLNLNTTGSYNIGVGTGALANSTIADNNTAVGYQAGYSNETGANLVAIGYQAGYTSNANNSTYVGYYAGQGTTGTLNTFVGVNGAGYLVSSGTRNTIIGGFSGNSGVLDIRTSSNYIVLSDGDGNIGFSTVKAGGTQYSWALPGAAHYQGTGITFPAAQNASSDANTLDDYEEGTTTVTFTPSTSGTITLSATYQTVAYTKVGRLVTITGEFLVSSVSSPVGTSVSIGNLPFASGGSAASFASGFGILDLGTGSVVGARVIAGTNTIDLRVDASTIGTNYNIVVGFSYLN